MFSKNALSSTFHLADLIVPSWHHWSRHYLTITFNSKVKCLKATQGPPHIFCFSPCLPSLKLNIPSSYGTVLSKANLSGFPGGPVVKNSPCNAGDTSSIPGWGTKVPRAVKQLSLSTATREFMQQKLPHDAVKILQLQQRLHAAKYRNI